MNRRSIVYRNVLIALVFPIARYPQRRNESSACSAFLGTSKSPFGGNAILFKYRENATRFPQIATSQIAAREDGKVIWVHGKDVIGKVTGTNG